MCHAVSGFQTSKWKKVKWLWKNKNMSHSVVLTGATIITFSFMGSHYVPRFHERLSQHMSWLAVKFSITGLVRYFASYKTSLKIITWAQPYCIMLTFPGANLNECCNQIVVVAKRVCPVSDTPYTQLKSNNCWANRAVREQGAFGIKKLWLRN